MNSRPATFPAFLYDDLMNVYGADANTGAYTVILLTAVPCRLAEASRYDVMAGLSRADGLESRILLVAPTTILDPLSQILVNGHRWNIKSGTDRLARGPAGEAVYRSYDVAHASTPGEGIGV